MIIYNQSMMKKIFITLFLFLLLSIQCEAQKSKPVIGISSDYVDNKNVVRETYTKAVLRAGGIPLILPQIEDSLTAEVVLNAIDGLILSGGEDVNPIIFGEQPHYALGQVNPVRDCSEMSLMKVAQNRNMPILGICRGMQLINVFYGGTLYQDIPTEFENNPICHSQSFNGSTPSHLVYITKGSYFSRLLKGADSIYVNSFHHQSLKKIAPHLKVVAVASDGVVEAVEGLPDLNVIGVQFHPEHFAMQGDERWMPIFLNLIERAETYRNQTQEMQSSSNKASNKNSD